MNTLDHAIDIVVGILLKLTLLKYRLMLTSIFYFYVLDKKQQKLFLLLRGEKKNL